MHKVLQPDGWPRPKGYANGILAEGKMVFTAGVVGWNEQEIFESEDLVGQFRQAITSMLKILEEAGAKPEHIVRMTWYITDREDYSRNLKEIGAVWRELLGKVYPCMACIQVAGLIEKQAKIEIETTAIIP